MNLIDLSPIEELLRQIEESKDSITTLYKSYRENLIRRAKYSHREPSKKITSVSEGMSIQNLHILKITAQMTFIHIGWICARLAGFEFNSTLKPVDSKYFNYKQKNCCKTNGFESSEGHNSNKQCAHKIRRVERVGIFFRSIKFCLFVISN